MPRSSSLTLSSAPVLRTVNRQSTACRKYPESPTTSRLGRSRDRVWAGLVLVAVSGPLRGRLRAGSLMTADNRGIQVSYEAIRLWCRKFGPLLATELRRRHPRRGDKWYLDEVALTINKHRYWLQLFGVALQMGSRTELIHLRSQPRGCTRGSSRQPDGGPHNRRWRRRVPPMASRQGRSTGRAAPPPPRGGRFQDCLRRSRAPRSKMRLSSPRGGQELGACIPRERMHLLGVALRRRPIDNSAGWGQERLQR